MKHKYTEVRVIKKYKNRRFYDTSTSTYVILEDIKNMLVEGDDIYIYDTKTLSDITHEVLLQIIVNDNSNLKQIISKKLLTNIIKNSNKILKNSLVGFLETSVNIYMSMQILLTEYVRNTYGKDKLYFAIALWLEFVNYESVNIEEFVNSYLCNKIEEFIKNRSYDVNSDLQKFLHLSIKDNQTTTLDSNNTI